MEDVYKGWGQAWEEGDKDRNGRPVSGILCLNNIICIEKLLSGLMDSHPTGGLATSVASTDNLLYKTVEDTSTSQHRLDIKQSLLRHWAELSVKMTCDGNN